MRITHCRTAGGFSLRPFFREMMISFFFPKICLNGFFEQIKLPRSPGRSESTLSPSPCLDACSISNAALRRASPPIPAAAPLSEWAWPETPARSPAAAHASIPASSAGISRRNSFSTSPAASASPARFSSSLSAQKLREGRRVPACQAGFGSFSSRTSLQRISKSLSRSTGLARYSSMPASRHRSCHRHCVGPSWR